VAKGYFDFFRFGKGFTDHGDAAARGSVDVNLSPARDVGAGGVVIGVGDLTFGGVAFAATPRRVSRLATLCAKRSLRDGTQANPVTSSRSW